MRRILLTLLFLYSTSSYSIVLDFESILDPVFDYDTIETQTNPTSGSGYELMADYTGSFTRIINSFGQSPSSISLAGPGTFTLNSFLIAGAWGSQTILIEGLLDSAVVYSANLAIDNNTVDVFEPSWSDIDAFRITTGNDYVTDPTIAGSGLHWAMDNLDVSFANETLEGTVPLPGTLYLLVLSVLSLIWRQKKSFR